MNFSCERDCQHSEMARKKNEVLIQWTEGSCKGETNRVNVKHILLDAQDITVGAFVTARLNSRKYQGEVKDLLEWSAPQKAKRRRKAGGIAKKATEDVSETNSEERATGSGTKTKQMRTSTEKASTQAKKAEESSLKKRTAKANKGGGKGKLHTTYIRTY